MNKKNVLTGLLVVILFVVAFFINKSNRLQSIPYVDTDGKFSIHLPANWDVQDKAVSTTTSSTWFHDSTGEEGGTDMRLLIGRFERTGKMNEVIKMFGPEFFLKLVLEDTMSGIPSYSIVSNKKVIINGVEFDNTAATYTGTKSRKKATQNTYLALTDEAYYLIGVDAYSQAWERNREKILRSINTLKLVSE